MMKRQMTFFGQVMRAYGLENLVVTGKIPGTRSRGRPRNKYVDMMKEVIGGGVTTKQLLNMAKDRVPWRSLSANVFNSSAPW